MQNRFSADIDFPKENQWFLSETLFILLKSWKTEKNEKLKKLMFSSLPLRASVGAGGGVEYSASFFLLVLVLLILLPPRPPPTLPLHHPPILKNLRGWKGGGRGGGGRMRRRRRRSRRRRKLSIQPFLPPSQEHEEEGCWKWVFNFSVFQFCQCSLRKNKASDKEHWFSFGN